MSDAELFVRCDCHSPDHMLAFDVWHWDTERPQMSELIFHCHLDPIAPWWKRLGYGLRYALTGKTGKWWWHDTVIARKDAERIHAFIGDYLANDLTERR